MYKLIFLAETNWVGFTNFSWKGFDGTVYSKNPAEVLIQINTANNLPEIHDFSVIGYEDFPLMFHKNYFIASFEDVENDKLQKIQIL